MEPLTGEVGHQAFARGSASMRRDLLFEHLRLASVRRARDVEQFVVGNAAPEEERQPRRQLEVADRDTPCPGASSGGILLDAEQELAG